MLSKTKIKELNKIVDKRVATIAVEQERYLESEDFVYKARKYRKSKGIDVEAQEYVTPSGENGYILIFTYEEKGKTYMRIIGRGAESEDKNMEWVDVTDEQ